MNEYKNLSKPIEETFTNFYGCWFLVNKANVLFGYEVITMIIVLVTTKEKSFGTNFNQENQMLVIRLMSVMWTQ